MTKEDLLRIIKYGMSNEEYDKCYEDIQIAVQSIEDNSWNEALQEAINKIKNYQSKWKNNVFTADEIIDRIEALKKTDITEQQ